MNLLKQRFFCSSNKILLQNIHPISVPYITPTTCYLLTQKNISNQKEALFIETNTSFSVPYLLDTLKTHQISPSNVKYIIVTHIHLDHASGTSKLLSFCPNATVLVHFRGQPHLVDPKKLISSAMKVYGPEKFKKLYGTIDSIENDRVVPILDGHCRHHMIIWDENTKSLWSGDNFGLSFPSMKSFNSRKYIFPTTAPIEFDIDESLNTLKLIEQLNPSRIYLTHHGIITDVADALSQMRIWFRGYQQIQNQAFLKNLTSSDLLDFCLSEIKKIAYNTLRDFCSTWDVEMFIKTMDLDLEINAQGLAFAISKKIGKKIEI